MSELREKIKHFMETHLICTWNELNTKEMLLDQILAAFKAHIEDHKPENPHKDVFINGRAAIIPERAFGDGVEEYCEALKESLE